MSDPLTDAELARRSTDLHWQLEERKLARRGIRITPERFGKARRWSTVSIVDAKTSAGNVRIVTTNDSTYYRLMSESPKELLASGEQLGSRPTLVYGPKETGKRAGRIRIHAEQLGANDAVSLGARSGRVASSNLGCDDQCVSLLRKEFPGFRHVNPQVPGTQPPPIPADAASPRARLPVSGVPAPQGLPVGPAERGTVGASRAAAPLEAPSRLPALARRAGGVARGVSGAVARGTRVVVRGAFTVSRALLRAAIFFVATFALDIVFIAFEVWQMIEQDRRERALQAAIDSAIQKDLPGHIRRLMRNRGQEVADFFLSRWRAPAQLFLYLSPSMRITSLPGDSREKYRFKIDFNDDAPIGEQWVSSAPMKPSFEEWSSNVYDYAADFRWSVEFPIFTPFDAYLAYLDLVGEIFSKSWYLAGQQGRLTERSNAQLTDMAQHMASIAASLMMDQYAGFVDTNPFNAEEAAIGRQAITRKVFEIVDQKVLPVAERLEKSGVLDADVVIVNLGGDQTELHGRLRHIFDSGWPISRLLHRMAADLESIPAKALRYQRREKVNVIGAWFNQLRFRTQYFEQLTADVGDLVPKARRVPSLGERPAGEVRLETVPDWE